MKPDAHLREIIRALRKTNETQDSLDSEKLEAIARGYKPPSDPLDADAAIRELLDFEKEISPELRYALARFLAGKIKRKPGRKGGKLTAAKLVARNVRVYLAELRRAGIPATVARVQATKRAVGEYNTAAVRHAEQLGAKPKLLSKHAIDAVLYPRNRRRKST